MANEASIRMSLTIVSGGFSYQSKPTFFNANVNSVNGPTPGALTVTTNGIDVTFSQLTAFGGLCKVQNKDLTNLIHVGIRDTSTHVFYPLMMLLPGEYYIIRLSNVLDKQEAGTGTFLGSTAVFHMKAEVASCYVTLDAFDP